MTNHRVAPFAGYSLLLSFTCPTWVMLLVALLAAMLLLNHCANCRCCACSAGYSFLLPFTWQTWLMFLIAMLVVVLLLTSMDIATRKARYAALEKVDSRKVQRSRKRGAAVAAAG
jgi:hypothetical protein